MLVVTEKGDNMIDTYIVHKNGVASAPTTHASAGAGPYGFAFTDNNKLVVSEAAANALSSYAVSDHGKLRTISSSIPTSGTGNTPCWVAINDQGTFAYSGNAGTGTISSYMISHNGALSLLKSAAATVSPPSLDLAFSKNSQFLYVLNGGSITGFKVSHDGSLSQVTSASGVPASAAGLVAT